MYIYAVIIIHNGRFRFLPSISSLTFDYVSIWPLTGPGLLLKNPTRHCFQEEMFKKAGWDVITGPHPVAVKGRCTSREEGGHCRTYWTFGST